MNEQAKAYRRVLRDVHARLLLMQQLADRQILDYRQMQIGLGKVIRTMSDLFAAEEGADEHQGEGKPQ